MSNTVQFSIRIKDLSGSEIKNLIGSLNGVDSIVDEIRSSVRETASAFDKAASEAFKLNQITDIISDLSTMLTQAVAPARSFETSMRATNTMAQLGEKEFDKLTDSVDNLSSSIPIARDLLGKGLYQTISNGVPKDNWLTFLERSARTSVGGIANLEKVVTVTSTIIKNYGLEWAAAGVIQDKIQTTAKNGVTNFEQLSEALPRVSGSAATLNVTIDELLGSFATLTGVSGNTAEVSTQLGAIMTALIKPTAEATRLATAMGIEFNAASIKAAGGFGTFLSSLNSTVDSYASANGLLKEEIMGTLFGSAEALRAVIPLTGELGSKFAENTKAMASSAGTIDAAFEQMNSTTDAAEQRFDNLTASLSDFVNEIVGAAAPYASFISQTVVTIAQLGAFKSVIKTISFKGFILGVTGSKIVLMAKSAALAIASKASVLYSGSLKILTVALGSAKLAAVAFWGAVTMGVGLLIYGVIEMITSFTGAANDNTAAMSDAEEANKSYNETLAKTKAEMSVLVAELENFNGTKAEEKKKVEELNSRYGETFGVYNTVADWYDTLVAKSGLYVKMMVNEAKIRHLANTAATSEIKLNDLQSNSPQTAKKQSGISKHFTGDWENFQNNFAATEYEKSITHFNNVVAKSTEQMQNLVKENVEIQKQLKAPINGISPSGGIDGGETLGLIGQIKSKIQELNKAKDAAKTKEEIGAINAKLKEQQTLLKSLENPPTRKPLATGVTTPELQSIGVKVDVPKIVFPTQFADLELRLDGVQHAQNEIARLKDLLTVANPGEADMIMTQIGQWQNLTGAVGENVETSAYASQAMGSLGSALGSMSGLVGEGAGVWLNYAGGVLQAVAQMIPALMAVCIGQATAGSMALPAPWNFIQLGLSLAAVAASFAAIPKFADGGIAYGPTLGIFGEYSGASNNPEVVAPLNKLRSLIEPQSSGTGEVTFKIEGRTLVGMLSKMNKINSRT